MADEYDFPIRPSGNLYIQAPTWPCMALFESKAVGQHAQIARPAAELGNHAHLFCSPPSSSTTMKRTRRQNKQAAAAAAEADAPEDQPMHEASPPPSQPTFTVAIPDDLDTEYLSGLLPDEINLDAPSPEDISVLYRVLISHALDLEASQRELEETKAEVERKDVELDQALQDKESGTQELEKALDNVQNELKQVKQERDEIGAWLCSYVLSYCPHSFVAIL